MEFPEIGKEVFQTPSLPMESSSRNNNPFDLLSDEILLPIFSLVDMAEAKNFGLLQVDTRFRRLCSSSITSLVLGGRKISIPTTIALLNLAPRLTYLDLNDVDRSVGGLPSAAITSKALKCCPRLAEIKNINCFGLTGDVLKVISEFGQCLRHVGLLSAQLHVIPVHDVVRALEGLESIDLNLCDGVFGELLEAIGMKCKRLTKIRITHGALSAKGGLNFLDQVKDRIQRLDLSGFVTTFLDGRFYEALGQCKELNRLELCHNRNLEVKGLLEIGTLPYLKHLTLYHAQRLVSDDLASAFGERKMAKLEHLNLTGSSGLDDTALEIVARNCPDLKCLDVSSCRKLTDVGVRQVLLNCGKMEKLSLRFLQFACGMSLFQDVHVCLPRLRCLDLYYSTGVDMECRVMICAVLNLHQDKDNPSMLMK